LPLGTPNTFITKETTMLADEPSPVALVVEDECLLRDDIAMELVKDGELLKPPAARTPSISSTHIRSTFCSQTFRLGRGPSTSGDAWRGDISQILKGVKEIREIGTATDGAGIAGMSAKPSALRLSNIKRFTFTSPTSFEIGIAKDASGSEPDLQHKWGSRTWTGS
jgi:hypothetical protein